MGSYAFLGMENPCPDGSFGASTGLSSVFCSGYCREGFYCPVGSISDSMFKCGGDEWICPVGSYQPTRVYSGFYTAYYDLEPCAPGRWRNYSSLAIDFSVFHDPSTIAYGPFIAPCIACPPFTYKSKSGNSLVQCQPCPLHSYSSPDNTECICDEVLLRSFVNYTLHFNISTGACDTVANDGLSSLTDAAWLDIVDNALTRAYQYACEPGFFCSNGR
jgi:hypothetical protein